MAVSDSAITKVLPGKPGTPADQRVPLNAGIWRFHPVSQKFEVFAHGTSNPWGLDFNDRGEAFVEACVIPHLWHIIPGGYYQRHGANPHLKAFVQGVTAAAAGAIAGAAFVLGKRAIYDLPTALIAAAAFAALFKLKKAPEPILIGLAGIIGFIAHSLLRG